VPAGKVEVLEVFSYGCPSAAISSRRGELKQTCAECALTYLPASFSRRRTGRCSKRAYFARRHWASADKTISDVRRRVKTGELAISDP